MQNALLPTTDSINSPTRCGFTRRSGQDWGAKPYRAAQGRELDIGSATLILTVGKHAVFDEVKRDYRFALRLMAGMSRRLQGQVRDVASDEGGSDGSHRVSLAVSKATVASRLSLTPEYFSRVPTPVRPRKLGFVRKQHHIRRLFAQRDERLIGR
jgi:hypothetical protein